MVLIAWFRKLLAIVLLAMCLSACDSSEQIHYIGQATLVAMLESDVAPLVIDVRTKKEYSKGHEAGAINIPHDHLVDFLQETPDAHDDEVVVYCERGIRADKAFKLLRKAGWRNIYHLEGDMNAWRKAQLPMGF